MSEDPMRQQGSVAARALLRGALPAGLIALALVGCSAAPSTGPTTWPASSPGAPSTAPSTAPTASPVATACPIFERHGNLPSDRLVAVRAETGVVADRVLFTFGIRSTAPTRPALRIAEVQPPFTRGASGLPVVVEGRRFLDVHFDGLLLFDEAGTPALSGDRDLHPNGLAIREVVNLDESEGVSDWVLGLSSGGCVEVSSPLPIELVVTVAH